MKKIKFTKTIASMAIVALLGTFVMAAPVSAQTVYPMVTLDDSANFTLIEQGTVNSAELTLMGLTASYEKVSFTSAEEDYISWAADTAGIVLFIDGWNIGTTMDDTDTVTVLIVGDGETVVTATYNVGTNPSVTSYILVEDEEVSSVSGIDITYNGDVTTDFTMTDVTVPLFDMGDALDVADADVADVLVESPTALHALIWALEIQNSSETVNTPIANFDWDWVQGQTNGEDNVFIESEGSYVDSIGADEAYSDANYNFYGWQFEVDDVEMPHAASATTLVGTDSVTWFFDILSW